ncbi:hypothetical protein C9374_004024 [Naegleria lovaniensis]|uniref:DUF4116 domain-containing protein n=1 Tax=Naegleria lovaniensis TaxID=51637 RepID=A0AA88H466_NAELO|nr:uncharacterized protein C9374_004024 [Naegleria lovaniensis]KAG2394260.1 hypothetical protein C9374_004024 [Naegleria lovaniensis]
MKKTHDHDFDDHDTGVEKKKLKYSSHDISSSISTVYHSEAFGNFNQESVKIQLMDFNLHDTNHSEAYHLLYRKFENQRKGFLKWFRHKQEFITRVRNRLCDYLPIEFMYDRDVILNIGIFHHSLLLYRLEITDKGLMLEIVQKNGRALLCASTTLREDRDVVLEAVHNDIHALRYASVDLQNDKEVVFQAFTSNAQTEFYIGMRWKPRQLLQDTEFILSIVRHNVKILAEPCCADLVQDFHFMLEALKVNVRSLAYSCASLRMSKEFMKEAVKINGNALEFASQDCQMDPEILSIACNNLTYSLQFATLAQRSDRQYVLRSLRQAFRSTDLQYASYELQNDRSVILEAMKIQQSADPYCYASEELRSDKLLALTALSYSPNIYLVTSENLQKDKEIIIAAIKNTRHVSFILESQHAIQHRNDPDVMQAVMKGCNPKFGHCNLEEYPEIIQAQDKVTLLQKVHQASKMYSDDSAIFADVSRFCNSSLYTKYQDEEFWLKLIAISCYFLQFIPTQFITKEFVIKALKYNGSCLTHLLVTEKFGHNDDELKYVAFKEGGFCETSFLESYIFNTRMDLCYMGAKVTKSIVLDYLPDH